MKEEWKTEHTVKIPDIETLFPGGYVIELETGKYLNGCGESVIRSSALTQAMRFCNRQQAKEYASRQLRYSGLQIFICEILWVLLSYSCELEGTFQYWTGSTFSDQPESAVTFLTYEQAAEYQRTYNLQGSSMIEQSCFRRERILIAA